MENKEKAETAENLYLQELKRARKLEDKLITYGRINRAQLVRLGDADANYRKLERVAKNHMEKISKLCCEFRENGPFGAVDALGRVDAIAEIAHGFIALSETKL